jgi:hypothetical protein
MGLSIRIFIVDEDDSLHRLALARYERLLRDDPAESIPEYAGKRVRYALIVVDLVNRKPVEIVHAEFSWLSFDSKGRLDRSGKEKEARLALEAIPPLLGEEDTEQLIDARHRFAKKRYDSEYRWKPTSEIEAAIVTAIFGGVGK